MGVPWGHRRSGANDPNPTTLLHHSIVLTRETGSRYAGFLKTSSSVR